MNLLTIVNEGSYILILFFYLGLLFKKDMAAKKKHKYFGYPLCLLVAITIFINIGVCIISVCRSLSEKCKKKNSVEDSKIEPVEPVKFKN